MFSNFDSPRFQGVRLENTTSPIYKIVNLTEKEFLELEIHGLKPYQLFGHRIYCAQEGGFFLNDVPAKNYDPQLLRWSIGASDFELVDYVEDSFPLTPISVGVTTYTVEKIALLGRLLHIDPQPDRVWSSYVDTLPKTLDELDTFIGTLRSNGFVVTVVHHVDPKAENIFFARSTKVVDDSTVVKMYKVAACLAPWVASTYDPVGSRAYITIEYPSPFNRLVSGLARKPELTHDGQKNLAMDDTYETKLGEVIMKAFDVYLELKPNSTAEDFIEDMFAFVE